MSVTFLPQQPRLLLIKEEEKSVPVITVVQHYNLFTAKVEKNSFRKTPVCNFYEKN